MERLTSACLSCVARVKFSCGSPLSKSTQVKTILCFRSTGLIGYFRRGLIDPASAVPFIAASLPACLFGAFIVPHADERLLKALYAILMLGLSFYLLFDEQG